MTAERYGRTWEIRLPWTKPPLSMNDRPKNWAAHAKKIAAVREDAYWAVIESLPAIVHDDLEHGRGLGRIDVTLTYVPRTRARRDRINLCATQKPVVDALVDCGLIVDDTPEYLTDRLPVIAAPDGDPRLLLTIREIL